MSWFEMVGAFAGNVHSVAQIMFFFALTATLISAVMAVISSQEYHEIEFVSLAKNFGSMSIFLGILMCAPTPKMMQEFSSEVEALKAESAPPAPTTIPMGVDKQGIPFAIKAESK